jgi:E3 ubiquitin-protein ligase HECTD2
MPPPWSSRILAGSSSNSAPQRGSSNSTFNSNKPLPRLPDPGPGSPTRLSPGKASHNRTASHPLPKLFGRKRSTGNLGNVGAADGLVDDALVPVLDQPLGTRPLPPGRVISGKKNKLGPGEEDDGKLMRRCMCCDSRVRVPKELDKFRCMCCLTVNDLVVVRGHGKDAGRDAPMKLPLSVERTRAIIEKCLAVYLQDRCRRHEERVEGSRAEPPPSMGFKKADNPVQTPPAEDDFAPAMAASMRSPGKMATQLNDAPVSTSPPDPLGLSAFSDSGPSAAIKDFADFDLFAGTRLATSPLAVDGSTTASGSSLPPSLNRKPLPSHPTRKPPVPPLPVDSTRRMPPPPLRQSSAPSIAVNRERQPRPQQSPRLTPEELEHRKRYDRVKTIFRPLEDYMVATFGDYECLNSSFSTIRPTATGRTKSESHIVTPPPEPMDARFSPSPVNMFSELDAKMLLLGDIGENGSWWATGKGDKERADKMFRNRKGGSGSSKPVSSKSPNINWSQLSAWYQTVHSAGEAWRQKVDVLVPEISAAGKSGLEGRSNIEEIEEDLAEAREHAVRALLKITENLLKRPTRPLQEPSEIRFLLIILANPSLYPSRLPNGTLSGAARHVHRTDSGRANGGLRAMSPPKSPPRDGSAHSGILKRVFGLVANASDTCHRYLITWFTRFDEIHMVSLIDLVASFVTHRIACRANKPRRKSHAADGGLIPDLSGGAMNTSAQLHAAMGLSGSVKKRQDDKDQETEWADDWQAKVGAKFMSLLFAANNVWQGKRREDTAFESVGAVQPQDKARRSGQLQHTSCFYNTLLDYHDLIADFKVWESKREKFAFCQYPLFLSMGAKIKILEYDARRQMEIKAREAYFDQVIRQRAIDGYFHLKVRRDCMVDDSLRAISEAVGAGQDELKKGLRVHFAGEEGVDAGGPRKEWFLMVAREVFDADHGLFVYDEESRTCYFNPNTFETSDQYYLVGALLGLAIYNSTILDVALPPFAFRKLLASAPAAAPSSAAATNITSITGTKGQMTYTLADLAEYRPSLAAGLQQLLDFPGDVESTYCWSFVAPIERYGTVIDHPLMSNGANTPVTNANRAEFVDLYIRYLLDGAVARQFEPFKRGFFTVCAGNALSLFRAEEIELLVRGSDEALNVDSLRAVAVHENWKQPFPPHLLLPNPAENEPVVKWFWAAFAAASPARQRKLLTFITGSDRIPAVGATSLVLRVVCGGDGIRALGEEVGRYPIARTCFNMLVLWRYPSMAVLEGKLWGAVEESEGFGLK